MNIYVQLLLLFSVLMVRAALTIENRMTLENVGEVVSQVAEEHFPGCRLLLLTTSQDSPVISAIGRRVGDGVLVVLAGSVGQQDLTQGLWGDTKTNCRALIIHLDHNTNNCTDRTLRQLDEAGMWQLSDVRVVVVGDRNEVESVLLHPSLRNVASAVFMAISTKQSSESIHYLHHKTMQEEVGERVKVYRRCLYCNAGDPTVQFVRRERLDILHLSRSLIHGLARNLQGRRMNVVSVPFSPYMDYIKHDDRPGGTITPKNCVDEWLLPVISKKLNVTYNIFEEPNHGFGLATNGKFNGMMGYMQREEADFCTSAGVTDDRLQVVNFLRTYPSDLMTLVSLKPTLLPQHLALIRPFEQEVWASLLVGVVVWGVTLWVLQRAWVWATGGRAVQFITALLYGWGALLEQPPKDPSVNMSGQMLVGWWLVFCLVISTGFRSSLIAHLSVQSKTRPVEVLEDLVKADNWRWGIDAWLLKGVPRDYFSKHTHPTVQHIHKHMEAYDSDGGLRQVLKGRFSFINFHNYISIIVASRYTDKNGYTPFFVSKKGFVLVAFFGYGFRKGAPFYTQFSQVTRRLEDAGIIKFWIADVLARGVRERSAKAGLDMYPDLSTELDDNREVVLGLNHLQGAFYLLFLGTTLAALTLLLEKLVHSRFMNR